MECKHSIREQEAYKDIRTFCYRCMMEYHNAGIKIFEHSKMKSSCDKCNRPGKDYIVK